MKRLNSGVAVLIVWTVAWFLLSLQARVLAAEPERISVEQLKSLLDGQADVVLVDARSGDNYDVGHIPGAISMPFPDEIQARHQELPRNKTVILYCS